MTKEGNKPEQWYTNKEIYEMVQNLTLDLRDTRADLKAYNELKNDVAWCMDQIKFISNQARSSAGVTMGESNIWEGIRIWGGWILALAMVAYHLWG